MGRSVFQDAKIPLLQYVFLALADVGALAGVNIEHLEVFVLVQHRWEIAAAFQDGNGAGHSGGAFQHGIGRSGLTGEICLHHLLEFPLPVLGVLRGAAVQRLHHAVVAAADHLLLGHLNQVLLCGVHKLLAGVVDGFLRVVGDHFHEAAPPFWFYWEL